MNRLSAFSSPFSAELVERLGWVLLHSLWQFALLAAVAGVISRLLRRSSAATRYAMFSATLALAVAAPVATWLLQPGDTLDRSPAVNTFTELRAPASFPTGELLSTSDTAPDLLNPYDAKSPATVQPQAEAPPIAAAWSARAAASLRPYLGWIVAIWGVGVALFSARPLLGWFTLRRLQRVGISAASEDVLAAVARVSKRLGLHGTIRVWLSTLAQVPVVVGYLRPVILLPVSLLTSLPAVQIEAILAHELAHVRRHDFVVNLLQTLVETLFFYHPAVWWLSRQIRVEREHCCDDLVVKLLGNRVEYGRALVAVEQLRGESPLLALGATDGSLLARIRRIVGVADPHAASLRSRWFTALLGVAIIALACGLAINGRLSARDEETKSDQGTEKPDANKPVTDPMKETKPQDDDKLARYRELPDKDVEKFVLETLRTPYNPDPSRGSWQGGAHDAEVLLTLSLVRQQQRVLLALLNVVNRTEEGSLDQRRLAMIYLGGAAPHQVLPILIRELEVAMAAPPDRGFPYHEIEVLGQIGEKARAAIPVLIKLLDSPDQLARGGAMDALTKIGPSSTEVMNALAEHLDDPRAVYRIARYGELAKLLGPQLVETLGSKSPECRTWAAFGLVISGQDAARGYEVLLADLAAGTTENRSRSATALAALGSQAKAMIPKLREFENDRDEQVAKEVHDAIRRIEKDDRIFTHAQEAAKKAESYKAAAEAQKQLRAAAEGTADETVEAPADEATAPPKGLEFLKPYKQLHGLSIDMTRKEFLALAERHKLKFRESGGTYRVPTGDGHTVLVMFRKGSDKCTGIQRLRGEDTPEPGKAADGEETKPAPDAESKNADPLQTKVSLAAEGMPLKLALTELARSAGLELQLNGEALKKVDLDVDEPVTATIKDEPLVDALGTLIDWEAHLGAFRELRGRKLIITTLAERQESIARHLPDWLQPAYNRGLLATLDDDNQIVSITAGEAIDDELMGRIKTLPKLRELTIETTKRLSPKGLDALSAMASLEKLSFYSMQYDGEWLGDAIIERIAGLKTLRELSLGHCGVTDEGVRRLEAMPQLTLLSLNNEGRLTDAALTSIGKLRNLKSLSLSSYVATVELGRMNFSADGIRRLIGLQQLEELHLVGQAVPAEALVFSRLKALSLGLDEINDEAAERIATLHDLTSLELVYTKITDYGLKKIAELPALARLNLDSQVVTDAGIGHLKKLPNLQHISLRATHLTDASLRHLADIKSLQRIDLHGSGEPGVNAGECFSMRGVNELKALPKLRTLWLTNVAAGGGYESLKDLKQLRELTLMMTDIRLDEFKVLEEALPNTRIHHVTGGGFSTEPKRKRAPKPGAAKGAKAEAPAPLPDIHLTGDEVTPEAIAKLSDRAWGTITLADARFNGEIIERLRHVPSIHTLRLFGEGLSGQIPRLETVQGLVSLEVSEPLKGRDLEAIAQLSNLESLTLPQEMTINVSGAREIAKLVKLKSLKLYNVNIDDAAFVELRTLVRLEELDLSHTRITDEGLATIVQMPLLRTLELHRYDTPQQLSDACLASIARLPKLERLSLSGKVTDAGLKQVARWPKLKSLSITNTDITGDGLAALADSNVESLTLSSSQISEDRFLEPLKKCRQLKSILVIGQPRGDESGWQLLLPNLDWSFSS
jgi:beta-lactamase regulating signal transducer with metallopeptidase domain/NADPH-dependent 7-cyano-7-deazaguanine reductase QueF-like protein